MLVVLISSRSVPIKLMTLVKDIATGLAYIGREGIVHKVYVLESNIRS